PVHHLFEAFDDVVKFEIVAFDGAESRADLVAADLVTATVDGIQEALGEIGASAEELHLLAYQHRRDAAGNRAIVAPGAPHDLVALELNRAGIDGHLGGEVAEGLAHARRVPDGEVRLRRGSEV